MMEYATPALWPELRDIWKVCFGDGDQYISYIFDNLIQMGNILVHWDDRGKPAAMLCMQPFTLDTPSGQADAAYIFGVATLPGHQGNGLSTALLEEAGRRLRERGVALSVLVPASEKLFRFYGGRGYETAFHISKAVIPADQIPAAPIGSARPARLGELAELRDRFFAGRSLYVRWDSGYLAYIGGECAAFGGQVLALSCGGWDGYAVCYLHDGSCAVKELTLPAELLPEALATLHHRLRARDYTVYLPADGDPEAFCSKKVLPFAMIRWYDKEKQLVLTAQGGKAPYIAHVLD